MRNGFQRLDHLHGRRKFYENRDETLMLRQNNTGLIMFSQN